MARAAGTACINTGPRVQDKAQGPGLRRDDECFEATSFSPDSNGRTPGSTAVAAPAFARLTQGALGAE